MLGNKGSYVDILDNLKYGKIGVGESYFWQLISYSIPLLPNFKYKFTYGKDGFVNSLSNFFNECGLSIFVIKESKMFKKDKFLYM